MIQQCDWRKTRLRPKVPYEKVAEMAKAAGRSGAATTTFFCETHYNGGMNVDLALCDAAG